MSIRIAGTDDAQREAWQRMHPDAKVISADAGTMAADVRAYAQQYVELNEGPDHAARFLRAYDAHPSAERWMYSAAWLHGGVIVAPRVFPARSMVAWQVERQDGIGIGRNDRGEIHVLVAEPKHDFRKQAWDLETGRWTNASPWANVGDLRSGSFNDVAGEAPSGAYTVCVAPAQVWWMPALLTTLILVLIMTFAWVIVAVRRLWTRTETNDTLPKKT